MGTPDSYEQQKRESRLKKIREMRNELRRIEAALNQVEHLVRAPKTPLPLFRQAALPLRGWVQSLVERYVVLEHVLSSKQDASSAMRKLVDLIWKAAERYEPAVIQPDPQPYYPDMIDYTEAKGLPARSCFAEGTDATVTRNFFFLGLGARCSG